MTRVDRIVGPESLQEASQPGYLQSILDRMVAPAMPGPSWGYEGGIIELGRGDFYGDLVMRVSGVKIRGEGGGTVIHGSIDIQAGSCELDGLTVRGEGRAYACKLWHPDPKTGIVTAGVPRVKINNCWFGPSFQYATNGPKRVGGGHLGVGGHGLWLDGAIIGEFRNCGFNFNPGSGVFIDTTVGQWSTNVNKFYGCTANGNGTLGTLAGVDNDYGYGLEVITGAAVGGSEGTEWIGGNIESNIGAGVSGNGINALSIRGTDFEYTKQIGNVNGPPGGHIYIVNCNPVLVEDCVFSTHITAGVADLDRAIVFDGVVGGRIIGCRGTGFTTNLDWIVGTESCIGCLFEGNNHTTDLIEAAATRYANYKGGR